MEAGEKKEVDCVTGRFNGPLLFIFSLYVPLATFLREDAGK